MHTERTLKWPENSQPTPPAKTRLSLKEWKAQHLAGTPANATAVYRFEGTSGDRLLPN